MRQVYYITVPQPLKFVPFIDSLLVLHDLTELNSQK